MERILSKGIVITFILAFSCTSEEPGGLIVKTGLVKQVDDEGVMFVGEFVGAHGQGITQYGFAYGVEPYFYPEKYISFMGSPADGILETKLTVGLSPGAMYKVRAYAKKIVNYSETYCYAFENYFVSQGCIGPVISGFEPSTVQAEDLVTIHGSFSQTVGDNVITIGPNRVYPAQASEGTIVVQLPYYVTPGSFKIKVTIGSQSTESADFIQVN